jgi:HEAT repeat protein
LLAETLPGTSEAVREAIAYAVGRVGRALDAEIVVSLLKDPSPLVRRAAVDALARFDDAAASEPLRLALADEAVPVRIAAAAALGHSGRTSVLDDLERLVLDQDPRVRAAAVRSTGRLARNSPDSAISDRAFAVVAAIDAAEGLVAMAAIEALDDAGGPSAAKGCEVFLSRPECEIVRAAVSSVGRHASREGLVPLLPLISHDSWEVRAQTIERLAERRFAAAVPPLRRCLEVEQDEFVRDAILRALERLED